MLQSKKLDQLNTRFGKLQGLVETGAKRPAGIAAGFKPSGTADREFAEWSWF